MEPIVSQTQTPSPPSEPAEVRPVISEHIGVRPGYCGGEPHILGHRIKVRHVAIWHTQMGMTPAVIAETYPTISLAQIHAALAYYYDHREAIEAAIAEEDQFVEQLRAGQPSVFEKVRQRQRSADVKDDSLPPG